MHDPEDRLSLIGILAMEEIESSVLDFLEKYLTSGTDRARIDALATELDRLHCQQTMIGHHRGNGKITAWSRDPMTGRENITMEFPKP